MIIARHHGNLPDFELPFGGDDSKECKELFKFIEKNSGLPVTEFVKHFEPLISDFSLILDVALSSA